MKPGRPIPPLVLSDEEKAELEKTVRQRTAAHSDVQRARVILLCAQGLPNYLVAEQTGISSLSVGRWRQRFVQARLSGLLDQPRSGAPRTISDAQVAEVVRTTLEKRPKNATHWSTRSLASKLGLSHDSIARIWKAFGLQPHRHEHFQFSTDPEFVDKVRDVVGLYMSPPQNAVVLCLDEKSQCQALERTQPILPLRGGAPERSACEYFRHGTTSLFAALNVATGEVIGKTHRKHTQQEFLSFLRTVERQVPRQLEIHAILDNYATHRTAAVKAWLARHPRWQLHFTPTYSSWLNQVERFFSDLTTRKLSRSSFHSVAQLEQAIHAYLVEHNRKPKPFTWTASADLILGKVQHLCNELL
ncbi:MAG: IS630 family transposase [Verrucomicrobia bacterium]|nr:IS630 family transposase [Verrucomicrobiota bacterium]